MRLSGNFAMVFGNTDVRMHDKYSIDKIIKMHQDYFGAKAEVGIARNGNTNLPYCLPIPSVAALKMLNFAILDGSNIPSANTSPTPKNTSRSEIKQHSPGC